MENLNFETINAWSLPGFQYEQRTIPPGESYVLQDLSPNTVYNLWLAAKSQRGEGAATASISVHTEESSQSKE